MIDRTKSCRFFCEQPMAVAADGDPTSTSLPDWKWDRDQCRNEGSDGIDGIASSRLAERDNAQSVMLSIVENLVMSNHIRSRVPCVVIHHSLSIDSVVER